MSLILQGGGEAHRTGLHKWETIGDAQRDTGRTIRLCVILLVMGLATSVPLVIMALVHVWLG
jgi:hypothetical protein